MVYTYVHIGYVYVARFSTSNTCILVHLNACVCVHWTSTGQHLTEFRRDSVGARPIRSTVRPHWPRMAMTTCRCVHTVWIVRGGGTMTERSLDLPVSHHACDTHKDAYLSCDWLSDRRRGHRWKMSGASWHTLRFACSEASRSAAHPGREKDHERERAIATTSERASKREELFVCFVRSCFCAAIDGLRH